MFILTLLRHRREGSQYDLGVRFFSAKPCDINAVESRTHTLDLISAVTLKLHLSYGATAFFSIGLPYALSQAGLPFGLLLLVVVASITGGCAGEKQSLLHV